MDDNVESLRVTLKNPQAQHRGFAAVRLGNLRDIESVPLLVSCLGDSDRGVSEAAATALMEIKAPEAVNQLTDLLRSPRFGERNLAIQILQGMGGCAVEQVANLTKDPDHHKRLFAIEILTKIGGDAVLDNLTFALDDENLNVATAAAVALGELKLEAATPALIKHLNGPDWKLSAVATSLGQIGGEQAVKVLLGINLEASSMVQFSVIQALAETGDATAIPFLKKFVANQPGSPLRNLAVQSIIKILDANYQDVVSNAADSIGLDILLDFLQSGNPATIASTVRLLAQRRDDKTLDYLVKLFETDNQELLPVLKKIFIEQKPHNIRPFIRLLDNRGVSLMAKQASIDILAAEGGKLAMDTLLAHLKFGDAALRIPLLNSAATFTDPKVRNAIMGQARHEDEFTRGAVAEVLDPNQSGEELTALVELLSDSSLGVKRRAMNRLQSCITLDIVKNISQQALNAEPMAMVALLEVLGEKLDMETIQRASEMVLTAPLNVRGRFLACIEKYDKDLPEPLRERFFGIIMELWNDDADEARIEAAKASRGFQSMKELPERLFQAVESDTSDLVRYEAARALTDYIKLKRENVVSRLFDIMEQASPFVRTALIETLSHSDDKDVPVRFKALLETETIPAVKDVIEEAMARLNENKGGEK